MRPVLIAAWLYYAAYPPLLYCTFLAEFFQDEQLDLDTMYYSEMRDAGCFEDDLEEEPRMPPPLEGGFALLPALGSRV